MKKKAVSLLLSMSLLGGILTGCGQKAENAEVVEEEKFQVETVSPNKADVDVQGEFVGTLEYADETQVFSKLAGDVTETFFEEGDYVEEGAVLFALDDETYQLTMRNAQAAYSQAQAGVTQQLGALAMNRDSAVNNVESAKEGKQQAQEAVDTYQYEMCEMGTNIELLKENLDDLEDDKDKAKKKLKKARRNLADATDAAEIASLEAAISGLKSAISSYESGISNLKVQINTYEQNYAGMNLQKDSTVNSYNQAIRGEILAQENLQYFDQYTAPGTQQSAAATMEQAEVGLENAKLQLEYTKVKAPVSGVIKEKNVDVHDKTSPAEVAYVITNEAGLVATFYVTETNYKNLILGQKVTVEREGEEYEAEISELPKEMDSASNLFKIKASVKNADEGLMSGTSVKLYTTTSSVKNVVTVPVDCVYYDGGMPYVYVVDNGIAKKAYVEIGLYDSENMEIKEGLTEDMQVITSWSAQLRDGLPVEVKNA